MKTFVPGAIAAAAEVNANFTEVQNNITALGGKVQHGTKALSGNIPANNYITFDVTFPHAFDSVPALVATSNGSYLLCYTNSVTATTASIGVRNMTAAAYDVNRTTVQWIATTL